MLESNLSDDEAKEFHAGFITWMAAWVAIAVVAHFLVWIWRPWFGPPEHWAALTDKAQNVASAINPYLS